MNESGKKISIDNMESLMVNLDEYGYFICFIDKDTKFEYKTLPSLIEKNPQNLDYEYNNSTKTTAGSNNFTIIHQGTNHTNQ